MKKLFVLLLALVSVSVVSAQKTTLELKLKKGETYFQNMNMTMNMTMNIQGMDMEMFMESSSETSYHVIKATSEYYEMEVKYGSMRATMDMPAMGINMVMDENTEGPAGEIFKKMCGRSFTMKMSKTGEVLEISGLDEIMNAVFEDVVEGSDAEMEMVKGQMAQYFGEDAMKKNFNMALIYPTEKVDPGYKWENNISQSMDMFGETGMLYKYEYKGESEGCNLIAVQGTVGMDMNIEQQDFDMNGTISGDIKADKKTGWISESRLINDIEGEMTVPNGDVNTVFKMSMSMEIAITDK